VVGLEWVVSQPSLLAVLLSPATLLLWDPKGEEPVNRWLSEGLVMVY
jgi:hypothetical protein